MNSRITFDPNIMLGKPVIKGTRITVEQILRRLSEGQSHDDLLASFPQLKSEDIYGALHFASDLIANEEIIVPKAS